MAVKFYKLVGYDPFGIQQDGIYPESHIEDILQETSYNNKRELKNVKKLTREMSNEEHGVDTENYQGENIGHLTTTGTLDKIADYIKVDANGSIYYYYLVNKTEVLKATKNDENLFEAVYDLDEYMTIGGNKVQIMKDHNPYVYVNMGFGNRGDERIDENNEIYYIFNYIHQRNLGNTTSDRNNLMVRKFAYSTTADDIFSLNFPNLVIPQTFTIRNHVGSETWDITKADGIDPTYSRLGRYKYIICKSSSIQIKDNEKIQSSFTAQQFLVIPLFRQYRDTILIGCNDFTQASYDNNAIINPFGDNLIGIFECDIPFSYFYGLLQTATGGAQGMYFAQQATPQGVMKIPFIRVDNNSPQLLKIIDYAKYQNGFYGKYLGIINNIYHGLPETEPALLNPMYYKEVYNNGESNMTIDASMFVFKGNARTTDTFGVEAYLCGSKDLALAYNFGENTNTELVAFDNTETTMGKGSITNFVVGSASANFYTTNANTVSTGVQTRQSEETQAGVDAGLDTAQAGLNVVPKNLIQAMNPLHYVKAAGTAAIQTAKIMTDTAMEQDRANKNFVSGINNITSSPSVTLSDPSVKGVIPNKKGLFATYSIELQDGDREVVFTNYLNNGYPLNCMFLFNEIATNRKIMNIYNFNTSYFRDDLMKLLQQNDNTIFNTKFGNMRFLAGLNSDAHVYRTDRLINCTDYMGEDYVDNIENELPDIPVPRDNIARFITNFRTAYEASETYILNALIADNPDAPEDIGDNVYITNIQFGGFIIKAFEASDDYYGSITRNATCYNGYILDGATRHYFYNLSFMAGQKYINYNIVCPDGTIYQNTTFNYPIIFNEHISGTLSIPNYFLANCYKYNQPINLPNYISSVGYGFLMMAVHGSDEYNYTGNPAFNNTIYINNLKPDIFQDASGDDIGLSTASTKSINFACLGDSTAGSTSKLSPFATIGAKIEGTYKSDFINKFVSYEMVKDPYRQQGYIRTIR